MRNPFAPEESAVALSEKKLRSMVEALQSASTDPLGRRRALRVPVAGFVTIAPLGGDARDRGEKHRVGVYDLSRTGIAVVADQPMANGTQFNVQFEREAGVPIEVMCTARHSRRHDDAYIIGAEFGVSWIDALGATVAPPRP
jgi:c-di-GMP-binding flagellar brake protein YcgR